jgi:hypothetical protein
MSGWAKSHPVITVVGVLFVGFWMFTDPTGLADLTKSGFSNGRDLVWELFTNAIEFFKSF